MRRPTRPVVLAGTLALLTSVVAAQESFAPQEGEVFPDMSFPTLDGEGFASLEDYRGQKVLLMQFASW